jgi:phosphinothricin acetyltransferase
MITIRLAISDDLLQINQIYNHYIANTAITFDITPWSSEQRQHWYQQLISNERYRVFVALDPAGAIIGFAYNSAYLAKAAFADSTELTVYTSPDNEIKGSGRLLYQTLVDHLKNHHFHRAYALITLPNKRSLRLHQQFGFEQVGLMNQVGIKFNQHHDVALLELAL